LQHVKKKFEPLADVIDQYGGFQNFFGSARPSYLQFFGLWLNRKRTFYRRAGIVAYGTAIAYGTVEPGDDYYSALTDGDVEGRLLRDRTRALRGG
jgi:hypothetical protein